MAHAPQPHVSLPAAPPPGHHASAEDEYLYQPPDAGHEHSDANVWIIVKFGLWLAISAIVISAGMGLLFGLFVKQSEETNPQFPLAVGQEERLPAAPRLQQFPENEFVDFRQREDAILKNYGWVNKETGVVRMPITDAMRLAVERGLPARAPASAAAPAPAGKPAAADASTSANATADQTATPQPTETPGMMPADSSAGRTLERRRQ
jgi:hypothetical protein